MQVFFENALKGSTHRSLLRSVRPLVCHSTGRLLLEGVAQTYWQKVVAQEACRVLARYYDLVITNNIEVVTPDCVV